MQDIPFVTLINNLLFFPFSFSKIYSSNINLLYTGNPKPTGTLANSEDPDEVQHTVRGIAEELSLSYYTVQRIQTSLIHVMS